MIRRGMSVLTRLLLIYCVIVALIALLGVGTFRYVRSSMEETLYQNLHATSTRMTQQLDSLIRPMEYTSLHLLSNHRFLSAAEDLAGITRSGSHNLVLILQAENEIHSIMMSYSLYKYFHRVSFFNPQRDFFSSNYSTGVPPGGYWSVIDSLHYLQLLRERDGRIVVLPPYADPWSGDKPEMVFSVARSIRIDPAMGYIEVQQPYSELAEIFQMGDESSGTSVLAVTQEGEILYDGGFEGELLDYYRDLTGSLSLEANPDDNARVNPVTGRKEVFLGSTSSHYGITVLLIQDQELLLAPLRNMGAQIFTLYLVMVLLTCLFFVVQSSSLVAPLRELKREMDITRLENLPNNGAIRTSNNEITSLSHAFNDLKERLNQLIQKELSLQTLHMQASFDALQAQINPHFIYNCLGMISNRAAIQGDDETCRMCGAIASMLRYSVNTKRRLVTLEDELEHLDDYIFLMKERFEHRLEYRCDVDRSILSVPLPKMVLQPLVENTFSHAFNNREGTMRVWITGRRTEAGWRVEIGDNGDGFSPETLTKIREKIAGIDEDYGQLQQRGDEVGGLGIVNIYARLKLMSHGDIHFSLGSGEEGGARITLGGPMPVPGDAGERGKTDGA